MSTRDFIRHVSVKMGKAPLDLDKWAAVLEDNFLELTSSLPALSEQEWTETMKFPLGLFKKIEAELRELERNGYQNFVNNPTA
jgi:hypothetical protein